MDFSDDVKTVMDEQRAGRKRAREAAAEKALAVAGGAVERGVGVGRLRLLKKPRWPRTGYKLVPVLILI